MPANKYIKKPPNIFSVLYVQKGKMLENKLYPELPFLYKIVFCQDGTYGRMKEKREERIYVTN